MGSGAKTYVRKDFLIYEEMHKYKEVRSYMTLHPIPLNFLIYEENFLFFFISVHFFRQIGLSFDYPKDWLRPSIVVT
jgi:hypothetical protein